MANVNYITEREAFVRHARDNGYSGNEQLLWYALFTIANERAMRNGGLWPDGFIRVTNKELLSWLPYSENTLLAVRADMINPAKHSPVLFDYIKGRKNSEAPQYRMRYFSAGQVAGADNLNFGGNIGGNVEGNTGGNLRGNAGGNIGDININNTKITVNQETQATSPNNGGYRAREGGYVGLDGQIGEARYDGGYLTSQRARGAVAQRLLAAFAGSVNTRDAHGELCELMQYGMPPELIEDCMLDCASTGELIAMLRVLADQRGYNAGDDGRLMEQFRAQAGGNERLAQAFYRMHKRRESDWDESGGAGDWAASPASMSGGGGHG